MPGLQRLNVLPSGVRRVVLVEGESDRAALETLVDVLAQLGVLLAFAVVLLVLGSWTLRRSLAPRPESVVSTGAMSSLGR